MAGWGIPFRFLITTPLRSRWKYVCCSDDEPVTLPEPKFPPKQSRLRQPVPHPQELKAAKKPKPSAAFDLWETELQKKVDIGPSCSEAEEHLMRYTKKKMPKVREDFSFFSFFFQNLSLYWNREQYRLHSISFRRFSKLQNYDFCSKKNPHSNYLKFEIPTSRLIIM